MIIFSLTLLIILSAAIDWYIVSQQLTDKKSIKLSYIAISATFTALILSVAILFKPLMNNGAAHGATLYAMWVITLFFMSFGARAVFLIITLPGLYFKKARRTLQVIGLTVALVIIGVMVYGTTFGVNDLRVETVTINSPHLPDSFDGYKIAQFSDTHLGNLPTNGAIIKEMVETINALNPDAVVFTGDLVNIHSDELDQHYSKILSSLRSRDGTYSVLGNHDYGMYIYDTTQTNSFESTENLIAKQQAMGWKLLQNETLWIHRGEDSIAISGVNFPHTSHFGAVDSKHLGSNLGKAMAGVPDSAFSILLSHSPQLFDSVPALARPKLTLSGHVHAMQFKINTCSKQYSPASLLYPMFSGLYKERGRYLYINDGIGYVLYPMRIGTKPEITIFELKSSKH